MPQETWFCEQCGTGGTVEYPDHAGAWEVLGIIADAHDSTSPNCQAGRRELRVEKVSVPRSTLKHARDAVRGLRIELEGGEPWLGGEDMVSVQRIWERDRRDKYVGHLRDLENMLTGLVDQ